MTRATSSLVCLLSIAAVVPSVSAQTTPRQSGSIEGTVVRTTGEGIGGVTVLIEAIGRAELTDAQGRYAFGGIPQGTYALTLSLGPNTVEQQAVVSSGPTRPRTVVDWPLSVFESIVVTGATRLPSRLVDAPSATTTLSARDIERQAASGQLPRLLAGTPGVELVQSGLFDFNVNSRGFNTFYNRHILTRVDGRDPSPPHLLGYLDWAAYSFPLDEIEHLEFIHGPGAALYGAGAFNGVLDLRTKNPRDSLGGKVRFTVGELNTQRVEFRQAVEIGGGWYFKGLGGYHRSGDFTRSRLGTVEYAPGSLPFDVVAPRLDRVTLASGTVRLDKYFATDRFLTFEAGTAHSEGPITVSPVARTQATDVDQPWFRFNAAQPRWNLLAYYTGSRIDDQLNLTANLPSFLHSSHVAVEFQGNRQFAGARGRVIGGVEYGRQAVDSTDPAGAQTVYDRARTAQHGSLFGQVEYRILDTLNGVFSARWDRSTLHAARLSPRAALVYSLAPHQTVRFTYGKAFQPPNLTEFYLRFPVAPPVDLSPLESALAPVLAGTALGFKAIPLLALGNDALRPEKLDSVEVGYQGVIGRNLLLNVSVYRHTLRDFTTNLLPQSGTSLGRLNPAFSPYRPPAALSPTASSIVLASLQAALPPSLLGALSNDADGAPIFALLSFSNFGRATTSGIEVGAKYLLRAGWRVEGSYTGFRSSILSQAAESPLRPNSPAHQFSGGALLERGRADLSLRYRWVDAFDWTAGAFVGRVPSYGIVDLNANYPLALRVTIGADVANLLDRDHFEAFGGDLLGRRALVHLTYSW